MGNLLTYDSHDSNSGNSGKPNVTLANASGQKMFAKITDAPTGSAGRDDLTNSDPERNGFQSIAAGQCMRVNAPAVLKKTNANMAHINIVGDDGRIICHDKVRRTTKGIIITEDGDLKDVKNPDKNHWEDEDGVVHAPISKPTIDHKP